MTTEIELFRAVKNSGEYAAICDETVMRVVRSEINKYKSGKQALKSVKTMLHQISCAFVRDSEIDGAATLIDGWTPETPKNDMDRDLLKILQMHSSTNERIDFFEELYADIFEATGPINSITDIACGFNPFAFTFLPGYEKITYRATDINVKSVSLINKFFGRIGIKGEASAEDALLNPPGACSDAVFLFKLLPLLERQKKGSSLECVKKLKCGYIIITFPTKSLSSKNVGMAQFYRAFTARTFEGYPVLFEKEYKNEIIFILANIY